VSKRLELARSKGASAGFDGDGTGFDLRHDLQKLVRHDPALEDHASAAVDAMKLKDVLGEVDTEGLNGYRWSPSCCRLSA
jgi:hypothetical protein